MRKGDSKRFLVIHSFEQEWLIFKARLEKKKKKKKEINFREKKKKSLKFKRKEKKGIKNEKLK